MTLLLLEYAKKIHRSGAVQGESVPVISRLKTGKTPMEEVTEIISLKEFDEHSVRRASKTEMFDVPPGVEAALGEVVEQIAQKLSLIHI